MTKPKFVAILVLLLSCGGGAVQAAAQPSVRVFCMKDEEVEYADKVGTFEMQARLAVTGSQYVLKVWNVMPDNSQILAFKADGTYQPKGPTRIRFIDSFENRGVGTFSVKGRELTIDIDTVKTSDYGANIGRNYGKYTLTSERGCRWEGD
jgi:hypothetical protein